MAAAAEAAAPDEPDGTSLRQSLPQLPSTGAFFGEAGPEASPASNFAAEGATHAGDATPGARDTDGEQGQDGKSIVSSTFSLKVKRFLRRESHFPAYDAKSQFIKSAESESTDNLELSPRQKFLGQCMASTYGEWLFGSVIFLNFVLIVLETDWSTSTSDPVPPLYELLAFICFVIYFAELMINIFVHRSRVFKSGWIQLDLVIVSVGIIEFFVQATGIKIEGAGTFTALRMLRLLRLLRALKLLAVLKELRKLLDMMSMCMRTLFWSFLLCFFVMTFWSIIAVQLLHGIVTDMHDEGFWSDCDVCRRYLASVMHCNLFFFQTVIAGDSWGRIAVPVVERHPWTMCIFGGALLTLVFGVLNLVVAVVVDTFADLRARDLSHKAMELAMEERQEKKELFKMFKQIDQDKSGELSFPELENAAKRLPEFRNRLRVLDIDKTDLWQLFLMIDRDRSGEIDQEEFIETLYRVKNTESKTATKIIKHYLLHMLPILQEEQRTVRQSLDALRDQAVGIQARHQLLKDTLADVDVLKKEMERSMAEMRSGVAQREHNAKSALFEYSEDAPKLDAASQPCYFSQVGIADPEVLHAATAETPSARHTASSWRGSLGMKTPRDDGIGGVQNGVPSPREGSNDVNRLPPTLLNSEVGGDVHPSIGKVTTLFSLGDAWTVPDEASLHRQPRDVFACPRLTVAAPQRPAVDLRRELYATELPVRPPVLEGLFPELEAGRRGPVCADLPKAQNRDEGAAPLMTEALGA